MTYQIRASRPRDQHPFSAPWPPIMHRRVALLLFIYYFLPGARAVSSLVPQARRSCFPADAKDLRCEGPAFDERDEEQQVLRGVLPTAATVPRTRCRRRSVAGRSARASRGLLLPGTTDRG